MSQKIKYSDFINTNQFAIDEINSSIKIEKVKIKKPLLILQELNEAVREISQSEFQSKLSKYQQILSTTVNFSFSTRIGYFEIPGCCCQIASDYNNRASLLTQITNILEELLITFNTSKAEELRELEYSFNFLYGNKNQYDSIHELSDLLFDITQVKELILNPLNSLKSQLKIYFKNKSKNTCIDIRQFYRRKVRFLFKNMDDKSGHDNNLFVTNLKQQFITTLIDFNHVQPFRFRSSKRYTKYKYTNNIGSKRSLASSYY
jgi:hypothetical protein